jgi:hypothetical protein
MRDPGCRASSTESLCHCVTMSLAMIERAISFPLFFHLRNLVFNHCNLCAKHTQSEIQTAHYALRLTPDNRVSRSLCLPVPMSLLSGSELGARLVRNPPNDQNAPNAHNVPIVSAFRFSKFAIPSLYLLRTTYYILRSTEFGALRSQTW